MAIVGTAWVRVKMLTDKLSKDIQSSVEDAFKSADLDKIGDNAGSRVGERLANAVEEAIADANPTIHPDVDTAKAKEKLEDLGEEIKPPVEPQVNSADATLKLKWLTRARRVNIIPLVNSRAMKVAEAALMRLTGARMTKELGEMFLRLFKNIDLIGPVAGIASVAIIGLTGSVAALASNLAGIIYGLGQASAVALPLPAVFGAGALGITTMVMAFKDMKTVLEDLGPSFTAIQDAASAAFWQEAETPIRNLATTWLPLLRTGFERLSTEMGRTFAGVADALAGDLGTSALETLFSGTQESTIRARGGVVAFTNALLRLTKAGSSYLPTLGDWFTRVGQSFDSWADRIIGSGQFFQWVDDGIVQLKALGTIISQSVGIFAALGRAAKEAGGATLYELGEGLRRINEGLSGERGQQALFNFFSAGHAAMAAMQPGLDAFGAVFVDKLLPAMTMDLPIAGQGLGEVFGLLADVLGNAKWLEGFNNMLTGTVAGLEHLRGASGPIAEAFGGLFSAFGVVSENMGRVLAEVFTQFGPAVADIADAIAAIVPPLAGGFVAALQAVGPPIREIVASFTGWIQENPALVAGLVAIGGGIGILAGLVGKLAPMFSGLGGIISKLGISLPTISEGAIVLSRGFQLLLRGAGIVGLLIGMYTQSERFREAVGRLGGVIMEALGPSLSKLGELFTSLGPFIGAALEMLGNLAAVVLNVLIPVFEFLAPAIYKPIEMIIPIIQGVVEFLTDIFTGLGQFFAGDFMGGEATIKDAFLRIFSPIVDGIEGFADRAREVIHAWLGEMGQRIVDKWNETKEFFSNLWTTIVEGVRQWAENFGQTITGGMQSAGEGITSWWESVKQWFADGWRAIVEGVTTFFQPFVEQVTNIFSLVSEHVMNFADAFVAPLQAAWETIKLFFAAAFLTVVSLFTGKTEEIGMIWSAFWSRIGETLSTAWQTIVLFVSTLWTDISTWFINGATNIGTTVSNLWTTVSTFFQNLWTDAVTIFTNGVNNVVTFVSELPGRVMGVITPLWNQAVAWAQGTWDGVVSRFNEGKERAISFAAELPGRVMSAINSLISQASSWASETWNGVVNRFNEGRERAVSTVRELPGRIVSALAGAASALYDVGTQLVDGLVSGITGAAGRAISAARGMVSDAISAARNLLGIASPSKVFREIGHNTGEGLVLGIQDMVKPVEKQGAVMAKALIKVHQTAVGVEKARGMALERAARKAYPAITRDDARYDAVKNLFNNRESSLSSGPAVVNNYNFQPQLVDNTEPVDRMFEDFVWRVQRGIRGRVGTSV